eukprot:TRINITY_DN15144_c0_g1_i12.p1 TRINITY_DN15144_c0_g1~~TRINITY_DN15144_c0_g1_i12.p1  ORF type:complete len:764 (+),score=122.43 TRINITY_DN15144_c0_g1_i12:203-2494(+)
MFGGMRVTKQLLQALLPICIAGALQPRPFTTPGTLELFVSPAGNDRGTGDRSQPLRTLLGARDRLRALRGGVQPPDAATVWLLPGTFVLDNTLNLSALDSYVSWRSLSEPALISGGQGVEWSSSTLMQTGCRRFVASNVPPNAGRSAVGSVFPELYVDGVRARITRAPTGALLDRSAFYEWQSAEKPSNRSFGYGRSSVHPESWVGNGTILSDISVVTFSAPWSAEPRRLEAVDSQRKELTMMSGLSSTLKNTSFVGVRRWAALNIQSGEMSNGEYLYASQARELVYVSCNGTSSPSGVIPTQNLTTLVRLTDGCTGVSFSSLILAHSAAGANPSSFSYGPAESGAVEIGPDASNVTLAGLKLRSIGNNAVQVMHRTSNVSVLGSVFLDIGGRAFTTTLEHTNSAQDASTIRVQDCVMEGCGRIFMQQPYCVFVSGSHDISIVHNDISDVPYSGIRVWAFNRNISEFDRGIPVFNVSFNHIHDVGLGLLSDFGAIFVTSRPGAEPDCVEAYGQPHCNVAALVAHNVVHAVRHFDHSGIGLYTDESSSLTNISHNLVFDCGSWGLHLHCGNRHSVQNNIFAGNAAQLPASGYSQNGAYAVEPFCNFRFHPNSSQGTLMRRNILDQTVAPSAGIGREVSILNNASGSDSPYGNLSNTWANLSSGWNLFSSGHDSDFPGSRSLAEWQRVTGEEQHSLRGRPGFSVDNLRLRLDFRLVPNQSEPARWIGFEEWDMAAVGPRADRLGWGVCSNDGGEQGVWWRGCIVH